MSEPVTVYVRVDYEAIAKRLSEAVITYEGPEPLFNGLSMAEFRKTLVRAGDLWMERSKRC